MKRPTKKAMIAVARLELDAWTRNRRLCRGLVMAILFAFIHRFTEGVPIEESFPSHPSPAPDYEI